MDHVSVSRAMTSVMEFFGGFIIGAFIEYIAMRAYTKWDPLKVSNTKLLVVVTLELFFIFLISQHFQTTYGLFTSQFFIVDYALTRFYNPNKNL